MNKEQGNMTKNVKIFKLRCKVKNTEEQLKNTYLIKYSCGMPIVYFCKNIHTFSVAR